MSGSIESIEVIQRLHSQRQFEGTGIRLFMVRRIIQRHGGNVWAYSRPQESTTLYTLACPRRSRRVGQLLMCTTFGRHCNIRNAHGRSPIVVRGRAGDIPDVVVDGVHGILIDSYEATDVVRALRKPAESSKKCRKCRKIAVSERRSD
jgi:hypothetical protein